MSSHLRYFVEGPCEKALIKAFMFCDGNQFSEGRVDVFNFVNERMTKAYARTIQRDSKVVIVIDTDVENTEVLEANIALLEKVSMIKREDIILVLSVKCFEDEIIYSCNLSNINQLFMTKGLDEFKRKFINHQNLHKKLLSVGFEMEKIWSKSATNVFSKYPNYGNKIKKISKHQ